MQNDCGVPVHHFHGLRVVVSDAIHDFHVPMTARPTHAHAEEVDERAVGGLPCKSCIPSTIVWLEKDAVWRLFNLTVARPAAKIDAEAVFSETLRHDIGIHSTLDVMQARSGFVFEARQHLFVEVHGAVDACD